MTRIIIAVVMLTSALAHAQLNVRDFGAKGDGETDDTAAFQRALDKAKETGDRVNVPGGRYVFRGHLDIPDGITLAGTFEAPARTYYNEARLEREKGAIFLVYEGKGDENAAPFITLHDDSHIRGVIIFYPEQTEDVIPYPWTIRGIGDNSTITALLVINPYNCVDFGNKPCGRHYINGLYAQPLKTGLFIDKCFDVGRVENVHFWPFWMDNKKLQAWTKKEATAFRIGRTDWEYMSNCFCIFYAIGFHFVANADGGGNALILNSGSDLGPVAVKVDHVQDHSGVSFTNCQFMSTIDVGSGNRGPVKFTASGFWGTEVTASHAIIRGDGNVTFDNCHFTDWARGDKNAPCIVAEEGGVTISASEFLDRDASKKHIALGEKVQSAIIMGNRFRTPAKIDNRSKGDVQIGLNTGMK